MRIGAGGWLRRVLAAAVWLLCPACGGERGPQVEVESPDKAVPAPKAPAPTGISLNSRPSGAAVRVDGVPRGNTPIRIEDLSSGDHAIRLELAGYAPWESQFRLEAGLVIELPMARLETEAEIAAAVPRTTPKRQWYETAAEIRPQPMPAWPKDRGLPRDLQVIVTQSQREIALAARADGSGVVTVRDNRRPMLSCSFAVDRRALARFAWRDFVEVMDADRPRPEKCCNERNQECCFAFSVSIRAFGRTLLVQEVAQHYLDYDLRDRVGAVIEGPFAPQRDFIETALSRLDQALSLCLTEPASDMPHRLPPHFSTTVPNASGGDRLVSTGERAPAPFQIALPRTAGRARLVATAERRSPQELACGRKAIAATTFPGSATCQLNAEDLGIELNR